MYSDISDYKKCVGYSPTHVGEAYGYSPWYVLYGTINHCMKYTGISHDFANAAKAMTQTNL